MLSNKDIDHIGKILDDLQKSKYYFEKPVSFDKNIKYSTKLDIENRVQI